MNATAFMTCRHKDADGITTIDLDRTSMVDGQITHKTHCTQCGLKFEVMMKGKEEKVSEGTSSGRTSSAAEEYHAKLAKDPGLNSMLGLLDDAKKDAASDDKEKQHRALMLTALIAGVVIESATEELSKVKKENKELKVRLARAAMDSHQKKETRIASVRMVMGDKTSRMLNIVDTCDSGDGLMIVVHD